MMYITTIVLVCAVWYLRNDDRQRRWHIAEIARKQQRK